MSRDLLNQAASEVTQASEAATNSDTSDRLDDLANSLRHQAEERQTTPALGTLDRIRYALEDVAKQTDIETVADPLVRAQEHILSFLSTLNDRGMIQHGWTPEDETPN